MTFTDQLHRKVEVNFPPIQIISLVPSQTELLHYLGLNEEVVGITKFCIHPKEWYSQSESYGTTKARIGGTKQIDFKKIAELNPDLIIGNKEENSEEQIKELMKQYPVWLSDIKNLDDALVMIEKVGELINKKEKGIELKNEIEKKFGNMKLEIRNCGLKKAAYFIWKEPMMVAGKNTFINDMLERCGFQNVFNFKFPVSAFQSDSERYPKVTVQDLGNAYPDIILLSSEPFPFKEKHIPEFQTICPGAKILLVDGEMFSWYGSRLLKAVEYFKNNFISTDIG